MTSPMQYACTVLYTLYAGVSSTNQFTLYMVRADVLCHLRRVGRFKERGNGEKVSAEVCTLGVVIMYFFQNLNMWRGGCHYTIPNAT